MSTLAAWHAASPGLSFLIGAIALPFAAWAILAPFALLLGPVVQIRQEPSGSTNAQNNPFRVWIAAPQFFRRESWLGVLGQEVYEFRYKWTRLHLTYFVTRLREEMELRGHAVECAIAASEGRNLHDYEWDEAQSLVSPQSSYARKGMFKGMSAPEVMDELIARRPLARAWVAKHRAYLEAKRP